MGRQNRDDVLVRNYDALMQTLGRTDCKSRCRCEEKKTKDRELTLENRVSALEAILDEVYGRLKDAEKKIEELENNRNSLISTLEDVADRIYEETLDYRDDEYRYNPDDEDCDDEDEEDYDDDEDDDDEEEDEESSEDSVKARVYLKLMERLNGILDDVEEDLGIEDDESLSDCIRNVLKKASDKEPEKKDKEENAEAAIKDMVEKLVKAMSRASGGSVVLVSGNIGGNEVEMKSRISR